MSGVGVVFITPDGYMIPHSFSLDKSCSNNIVKYQALIMGMEIDHEAQIRHLEIHGDKFIVNQMNNQYEVKKPDIRSYHKMAQRLINKFIYCNIENIPRSQNARANALASLAALMALPEGEILKVLVCERRILPPLDTHEAIVECQLVKASRFFVCEMAIGDWHDPFINYMQFGILLDGAKERTSIRWSPKFYYDINTKTIYRKSYDGILLHCLYIRKQIKS